MLYLIQILIRWLLAYAFGDPYMLSWDLSLEILYTFGTPVEFNSGNTEHSSELHMTTTNNKVILPSKIVVIRKKEK